MISAGHDAGTTRIGVVGGGFSAAAVVFHLAGGSGPRLDITLYEPRERVGHGVAYSVFEEHLLLNVPAGRLSIDPARPTDFLEWCLSRGYQADAGAFLPRSWFGAYAESRMAQQVQSAGGRVTLRRVRNRVERIREEDDGLRLFELGGGHRVVDHAVLALGHGPTRVPDAVKPHAGASDVLRSPWDRTEMARLADRATRVLLIGTGLTMCDAAVSLARLGFKGEMTAISRHGLLPQVHGPSDPKALTDWRDRLPAGSLLTLLREVGRQSLAHDWRSVIDALRPRTSELWGALSAAEQARFVRRLATFWDTHRHRLPPECAEAIRILRQRSVLRVTRGHVSRIVRNRSWLTCDLLTGRDARPVTLHTDGIVLCTGPESDPRHWGSGVVDGLLQDGLASPEANGLGLRTTPSGLLVGRGAVVQRRLSTLGPPRRGSLWESTAVPEIAQQAVRLAALLAEARLDTPSGRPASLESQAHATHTH